MANLDAEPTSMIKIDAGELTLSARLRLPGQEAKGVVVALHGGTYDSSYYQHGEGSLLDLAAALGYIAIAVDRPGYGSTHGADPQLLTFDGQTSILSQAIASIWSGIGERKDLVLTGHSIGGMLALCVAAAQPPVPLCGVGVDGIGELWQPGLREMWSSLISDASEVVIPADAHNQVMYGPKGSFDPGRQARLAHLIKPLPMPELTDVVSWSGRLPSVAANVHVPVCATFAEHDHIWQSDQAARLALARHFTASPLVRAEPFPGVGHSIELHFAARAYQLRQLAFAEEVILRAPAHSGVPE